MNEFIDFEEVKETKKIKTILFFCIILVLISSSSSFAITSSVNIKNDRMENEWYNNINSTRLFKKIPAHINPQFKRCRSVPLGSSGPIISFFLELWARYTDQYFEQPREWREFELQRQRIREGTEKIDIIIVDDEGDGDRYCRGRRTSKPGKGSDGGQG